ncbi:MAG: transketolase C-terminal domain-containing protein, partial [Nitriliruptoraceae bacterium]
TAPLAARRLHVGADAGVLAVGDRVRPAVAAAHALAAEGLGVTVWDVRSVRPADPAMLADAAAAPLVVTVENGVVAGGAGAELADRIAEVTGPTAAPPVVRLGVPGRFLPHGDAGRILADLGLDAPGIAAAVRAAVAADGRDRPTAARP